MQLHKKMMIGMAAATMGWSLSANAYVDFGMAYDGYANIMGQITYECEGSTGGPSVDYYGYMNCVSMGRVTYRFLVIAAAESYTDAGWGPYHDTFWYIADMLGGSS